MAPSFHYSQTRKWQGAYVATIAVGCVATNTFAQTDPVGAKVTMSQQGAALADSSAPTEVETDVVAPGAGTADAAIKIASPEGEPLPVYVPPSAAPTVVEQEATEQPTEPTASAEDEDSILYSGYLPGYRPTIRLGEAPNTPRVGTLPGGMSGNFNAPMPPNEWVFSYGGSLTAALRASFDQRVNPNSQQASTVFHVAPETVEVYNSFLATRAVPDNWASVRFEYGNARVKATVSIDTWNPTQPTTYYQLGSQYFINNAFMTYSVGQIAGATVTIDAGYVTTLLGELSGYSNRMYTNPLIAGLRGAGLRTTATYPLTSTVRLYGQHQLLLDRVGLPDKETIPNPENSYERPYWAHPLINALTLGFNLETSPRLEFRASWVNAFATDDRLSQTYDDVNTRQDDEFVMQDPRMDVLGGTAQIYFETWGLLGLAGGHIIAQDAYPLRSVNTFASFGEELTDRWLGVESSGNGSVSYAALNYELSVGRVVSYPAKFEGHGPDIFIKTGLQVATSSTEIEVFNDRWRYKGGLDVLYTFYKHLGIGVRVDHVAPNSKDSRENFQVVVPRIQFKTDWTSRDTFNLMYARWFYGSMTRNEGTGERSPAQLDDDFFGFSVNMWW